MDTEDKDGKDVTFDAEDAAASRGPGFDAARRVASASPDELKKLADGDPSDLPVGDALEYLVGAFEDPEAAEVQRVLRVNVGSPGSPKIIRWVVKSIPGLTIRKIREDADEKQRRTKGQSGTKASFEGNVRVVIAGTVDPDIAAGARRMQLADPADFLETALQSKQGLIDQIAGAVLTLSGYDDEDVNDEMEAKAAGN